MKESKFDPKELFEKIKKSFFLALKGEEKVDILIWRWGAIGYVFAYVVIDSLIKMIHYKFVDVTLSLLAIVYFASHFYVLRKSAPKGPKLTKEEKRALRKEARKGLAKKFFRKLFLQESLSKWDPISVTLMIDIFCIVVFLDYMLR